MGTIATHGDGVRTHSALMTPMRKPEEFIIAPPKRFTSVNWRELWRYRDLFVVFAWREIAVRYKQTVLGVLWAIFQPMAMMVIFTFIFNRMAKIESGDGSPYPIFLFVGLLLWQYFSATLANASNSMIQNAAVIQKVYFPRLIIPASTAIMGLVDLAFGAVVLVGLMVHYGYYPHLLGLAILPVLLASAVMYSLGLGLFLASLNIKYRDVRHALPFVIQILMYLTPVIYPVSMLENHPVVKNLMIWLNPISGVIANARAGLLGVAAVDWGVLGISVVMSVAYLVFGLYYFRATERSFADII
jgi:lipopolysaccharide transport system permease protein